MARHVMVVLTNAVAGKEKEFNDWYTDRHLPDVLTLPGAVSAQRFELGPTQRNQPPHPYKYLALYEFETSDIEASIAQLRARAGTASMPLSDTLAEQRFVGIYEPITGLVRPIDTTPVEP